MSASKTVTSVKLVNNYQPVGIKAVLAAALMGSCHKDALSKKVKKVA